MSDSINPNKLAGKGDESSKTREFLWDSISLYIVGVIISFSTIDILYGYLQGDSGTSCTPPPGEDVQENYILSFCEASLPWTVTNFPILAVFHGILIAIPHYFWLNYHEGNFQHFSSQVNGMERLKDESGEYPSKNYTIVKQLMEAFSTYGQNGMLISYRLKVLAQATIVVSGLIAFIVTTVIFDFNEFRDTFICPLGSSNNTTVPFWPLPIQVQCVSPRLHLVQILRFGDLVLLVLLTLTFIWTFIWTFKTHSTELGSFQAALFSFYTGISPLRFVPKLSLAICMCCSRAKKSAKVRRFIMSIPWCEGPQIKNDLDFLVLKLFRSDKGLGFIFREVQILQAITMLNKDDQQRAKLHIKQQRRKAMKDGDLIAPPEVKGYKGDLKWTFTKAKNTEGIFSTSAQKKSNTQQLLQSQSNVVVRLPDSFRGAILGFSALAEQREVALYISFGSKSLGVPYALSRVFSVQVGIINFDPCYNNEEGHNYTVDKSSSGLVQLTFPFDVLSSNVDMESDVENGLMKAEINYIDFVVVGPLPKKEIHLPATLSFFLDKIKERCKDKCVLLVINPLDIAGQTAEEEFHTYEPPKECFEEFTVKVARVSGDPNWPPLISNSDQFTHHNQNLSVATGDTHSTFMFRLYQDKGLEEETEA